MNPAPALDGISEPTNLVAFDMTLNASASATEDIVYRVVKGLYGGKSELTQTFAPFALFDPAKMGKPNTGIDTHPGRSEILSGDRTSCAIAPRCASLPPRRLTQS